MVLLLGDFQWRENKFFSVAFLQFSFWLVVNWTFCRSNKRILENFETNFSSLSWLSPTRYFSIMWLKVILYFTIFLWEPRKLKRLSLYRVVQPLYYSTRTKKVWQRDTLKINAVNESHTQLQNPTRLSRVFEKFRIVVFLLATGNRCHHLPA